MWLHQILCTHKLCVSGGVGSKYLELNRRMLLAWYTCFMLLQGTESSQLVATDFQSCGQLQSIYPVPIPPKVLEKQKINHKFLEVDHSKQCLQRRFTGVLGPPPCIISASPIICSSALPIKHFPHMLFLYPCGFAVPICCFQGSPRQRPPPVSSARGGC